MYWLDILFQILVIMQIAYQTLIDFADPAEGIYLP